MNPAQTLNQIVSVMVEGHDEDVVCETIGSILTEAGLLEMDRRTGLWRRPIEPDDSSEWTQ